jgi:hypothetical protein
LRSNSGAYWLQQVTLLNEQYTSLVRQSATKARARDHLRSNYRVTLGGFDSEDGEERCKLFEVVMVTSDGDGRISEESLRTFPDLAERRPLKGERASIA